MTAENPKWIPVDIAPYQTFLSRVFGEGIESPLLSPDKEQALIETINEVLATLPPRMRQILELRCGLSEQGSHTLMGVGQLLDPPVSKERVRQLEAKALRRLRHSSRSRKLKVFLPLPEDSIARSIAGLGVHEVAPESSPTHEGTPINELRLNTLIINALKGNSIRTVEAVSKLSREDLLRLRRIGPTAAEKIEAALIAFYSEARRISDMVLKLFGDPNVSPADLHELKTLVEKLATTSSQPRP